MPHRPAARAPWLPRTALGLGFLVLAAGAASAEDIAVTLDRAAVLKVLPDKAPGMGVADVIASVKPHLSDDLFPGGETAGWWAKAVQLDLEAKKVIARTPAPVRLYKSGT